MFRLWVICWQIPGLLLLAPSLLLVHVAVAILGFPKNRGTFSGGLNNDDSSYAGPTLGSHYLGKLPFIGGHQAPCTRSCLLNLLDSCFYYTEFVRSCCLGQLFFSANHMFLK